VEGYTHRRCRGRQAEVSQRDPEVSGNGIHDDANRRVKISRAPT
jgi:hypothetical protein